MSAFLTYENWNNDKVASVIKQFGDYLDVIKWAFREYGDNIVYACSFGAESVVLIDLISKVKKDAKIVFIDTSFHFKETYELIEKVKRRYPGLQIERVEPQLTPEAQALRYGDELWKKNPDLCCYLRKVVPLKKALEPYPAWISGLRREQSPFRKNIRYINKDDKFRKIKVCPLIHWSREDIQMYTEINNLPCHSLVIRGYPSVGCAPCTKPVKENENARSGRWAGTGKTECGLHVQ